MLLCHRFESNAYRVLGLSAAATSLEADNAAAALRRSALFGTATSDSDCFGEIDRSDLSIRSALETLSSRKERVAHRLLWFYGPVCMQDVLCAGPWPKLDPDEAAHDSALSVLVSASLAGELPKMVTAIRAWHTLMAKADYWVFAARMEAGSAFEPAAGPAEFESLRTEATALAAEPLVAIAKRALAQKAHAIFRGCLAALQQLADTGAWAAAARTSLLFPLTQRLNEACATLEQKFSSRLIRREHAAETNRLLCAAALHHYRQFVEPAWNDIAAMLDAGDEQTRIARGQTADALRYLALDHVWSDEVDVTEELAVEAVALAKGTSVEERVRTDLKTYFERGEERLRRKAFQCAVATLKDAFDIFDLQFSLDDASGKSGQSIATANDALAFFRKSIEPPLKQLVFEFRCYEEDLTSWRARGSACLARIAGTLVAAMQVAWAADLLTEALAWAAGTDHAEPLERELSRIQQKAEKATSEVADDPMGLEAIKRVHLGCRTLAGWHSRVREQPGYAQTNRVVADDELALFDGQIGPGCERAARLLSPNDSRVRALRLEAAHCLASVAIHFSWANDAVTADMLIQRALGLAEGTGASDAISQAFQKRRCPTLKDYKAAGQTATEPQRQATPLRSLKPAAGRREPFAKQEPLVATGAGRVSAVLIVLAVLFIAYLASSGRLRVLARGPNASTSSGSGHGTPPASPPQSFRPPPGSVRSPADELRMALKLRADERRAHQMERQLAPLFKEIEAMQRAPHIDSPAASAALSEKIRIYQHLRERHEAVVAQWRQDIREQDRFLPDPPAVDTTRTPRDNQ